MKDQLSLLLMLLVSLLAVPSQTAANPPALIFDWQGQFSNAQKARVESWLKEVAEQSTLLNGHYPQTSIKVSLRKRSSAREPVPWAQTVRWGRPHGIVFYVNPNFALADFRHDWTALHEFSHLQLPYIGTKDAWLSEGFASYYQYILMARAGLLTSQDAWNEMIAGFERGERDPNQNISLAELVPDMRSRRAFKRVYWTGAHFFLTADIALRKSGSSLDEVIHKFQSCCRQQHHRWNGEKLVAALDEASGSTLFSKQFRTYQRQSDFPDYTELVNDIGIQSDGHIWLLSTDHQYAAIRDEIMELPASIN